MQELDTIEAQVAQDRSALAASLQALTEAADPKRAAQHVATMAESYGGTFGREAWSAVQRNPAAFVLMGAGIGLLVAGTGARAKPPAPKPAAVPPEDAMEGFDARLAAADAEMKSKMSGKSPEKLSASWMRAAMNSGLDKLSPGARKRVLRARKAALRAQERVEAQAARIARRSRMFAKEQPLAMGAVALGLGALAGALLPPTRQEDAMLGKRRDALMEAAQEALRTEIQRVENAATACLEEHVASAGRRH